MAWDVVWQVLGFNDIILGDDVLNTAFRVHVFRNVHLMKSEHADDSFARHVGAQHVNEVWFLEPAPLLVGLRTV